MPVGGNVVLTGFMGVGKSTVGQLLAQRLDYQFVDSDALIELRTGRAVPAILTEDGEAAFRRQEALVARELAGRSQSVIATGGGTLLNERTANRLARTGTIVCLTADPEIILDRVAAQMGERPLLDGEKPLAAIRQLLEARAVVYGRYPQVDTSSRTPEEVVTAVLDILSRQAAAGDVGHQASKEPGMYFCDIEKRQSKEIAPGVRIRTFWGDEMLLAIVDLDAGSEVPRHAHLHEQVGSVLHGELRLTIAGEERWLKPGDSYVIPGGIEHGALAGDGPVRLVDVFSPVREEYKF